MSSRFEWKLGVLAFLLAVALGGCAGPEVKKTPKGRPDKPEEVGGPSGLSGASGVAEENPPFNPEEYWSHVHREVVDEDGIITVATFNMKNLGADSANDPPDGMTKTTAELVADMAKAHSWDLIALQEVLSKDHPETNVAPIISALNAAFGPSGDWVMVPNPPPLRVYREKPYVQNEFCPMLYNRKTLLSPRAEKASGYAPHSKNMNSRPTYAFFVANGDPVPADRGTLFDFMFICVHMPQPGKPKELKSDMEDLEAVIAESRTLAQKMGKTKSGPSDFRVWMRGDPDVIVAGDFNADPSSPLWKDVKNEAKVAPLSKGSINYSNVAVSTHELYDNIIWNDPVNDNDWTGEKFVYDFVTDLFTPPGKTTTPEMIRNATTFSDHMPVWATFWKDRDDL